MLYDSLVILFIVYYYYYYYCVVVVCVCVCVFDAFVLLMYIAVMIRLCFLLSLPSCAPHNIN